MRTDLTRACPECRTRTFPQERCPKCDGALVDLRDEQVQKSMLESAWHRDAPTRPRGQAYKALVWLILSILFLAWIIRANGRPIGYVFSLAFIAYFGVILWHELRELRSAKRTYAKARKPKLLLAPSRVLDEVPGARRTPPPAERLVLRGQVRTRTSHTSLLYGEDCVAFGLVGSCDASPINDADGTSFDLLVEGSDDSIVIELDHAVLDLPTPRPREVHDDEPRPHLDAFLASRGIAPGRLLLGESLLRDGDTVEVTGPSEVLAEPGTYRESTYVRTFRGTAEDPVRIQGTKTA